MTSDDQPTFLETENEIQFLLLEHQHLIKLIDEEKFKGCTVRQANVQQAKMLISDIESLHKMQKKLIAEELKKENNDVSIVIEDKFKTKEKLEFLSILNLAPRKLITGEPENRKSRRNRMPATKLVLNYGATTGTDSKPHHKKRLIRKKPVENHRPSSTPSSAAPTVLPTRFITECLVDCDICKRPFKVHRVSSPLVEATPQKNVCFGCQMNADQLIFEESLNQNVHVGSGSVSSSVINALKLADAAQTLSRSSSPGYHCD